MCFVFIYLGPGAAKKGGECVVIAYDCDKKKSEKLEEEPDEFPRMVLYFKGKEFDHAVLVADNVRIDTQAYDIAYASVLLISSYYVFNIRYPLAWQNFLGLLQHIIVGEPFLKGTSSSVFANKLVEIEQHMEKDGPVFNGAAKQQ